MLGRDVYPQVELRILENFPDDECGETLPLCMPYFARQRGVSASISLDSRTLVLYTQRLIIGMVTLIHGSPYTLQRSHIVPEPLCGEWAKRGKDGPQSL